MPQEEIVKQTIESACNRLDIKSHLFLYVENNKVKLMGSFALTDFGPLLADVIAKKMGLK